jgi:hypothetical protein
MPELPNITKCIRNATTQALILALENGTYEPEIVALICAEINRRNAIYGH